MAMHRREFSSTSSDELCASLAAQDVFQGGFMRNRAALMSYCAGVEAPPALTRTAFTNNGSHNRKVEQPRQQIWRHYRGTRGRRYLGGGREGAEQCSQLIGVIKFGGQ